MCFHWQETDPGKKLQDQQKEAATSQAGGGVTSDARGGAMADAGGGLIETNENAKEAMHITKLQLRK